MYDNIRPFEMIGDIWQLHSTRRNNIVIPTNGTVTVSKKAVMGRGLAADAVVKYPKINHELGRRLLDIGNHVHYFPRWRIVTFPVKHEWHENANIELIMRSTIELQQCIIFNRLVNVIVPHVGCGNGGLLWDNVKPILQAELDHRCTLVTWRKEI